MADQGRALSYIAECLLDRVGSTDSCLWVADRRGRMELAAARGAGRGIADPADIPAGWHVTGTPRSEAVLAVLATRDAPDRGQDLLDNAAAALADAAGRPATDAIVSGLLEAIGDQTAIIDEHGRVVRCNRAWREAPAGQSDVVERSPVGTDYPSALNFQGSRAARIAAQGVRAVLLGSLPSFQSDYDTGTQTGDRSFSLTVAPLPSGGAVVRHVDISFRKHLQRELAHRATHDSLTGLPNRMVMMDRLSQALARAARTGSRVGLLFCDVDRFKQINDVRGHIVGDHVLSVVADRLQRAVGQSDVVARFGGDEFVVLLESVDSPESACTVARSLQQAATQPIRLDGDDLDLGLTIGVTTHDGHTEEPGQLISRLLAHADSAMYTAKASGRGGIHLVDAA